MNNYPRRIYNLIPYLLFLVIGILLFPSSGRDDVHITYGAAHALSGYGEFLNYNGDRIEQSSSLLHTVLLALLAKFSGLALPTIGAVFSISCSIVSIWLIGRLAITLKVNQLSAQIIFATATPFVYWGFSGLDAVLASACFLLFIITYYNSASQQTFATSAQLVVAIIACLTVRPEAMFVLLVFYLGILTSKGTKGKDLKFDLISILVVMALATLLTYWRLCYFGSYFPQPVEAKIGGTHVIDKALAGVSYLYNVTTQYLVFALLIYPAFIFIRRLVRREILDDTGLPVYLFSLTYVSFVVFSGGDWMEGGRFIVPVLPLVILSSLLLSNGYFDKNKPLIFLMSLNIACSVYFSKTFSTSVPLFDEINTPRLTSEEKNKYSYFEIKNKIHYRDIVFLEGISPIIKSYIDNIPEQKSFQIMSSYAGMVAFYLLNDFHGKLRFIDDYGLTTPDFTNCVISKEWKRGNEGIRFSYSEYFSQLPALANKCGFTPPEFIFNGYSNHTKNILEKNGYIIVYIEQKPYNLFFAVREDIYRINPIPKQP